MFIQEKDLYAEIKASSLAGSYFLFGEEDYLKKHRIGEIRTALFSADETAEAFNAFSFFYGEKEFDPESLESVLMSPPMMADKKLVICEFASFDKTDKADKAKLARMMNTVADESPDDTVFAVCAVSGGFDSAAARKKGGFLDSLSENVKVIEFSYRTPEALAVWISKRLKNGFSIDIDNALAKQIVNVAGSDMTRLRGETDKLGAFVAAAGRTRVTERDIEDNISRTDEEEAFRMANAVIRGDTRTALLCLNIKKKNREEPVYVLSQINKTFSDLGIASLFIKDGRDLKDYTKSMKMSEHPAKLRYNAAKLRSTDYFGEIMERAVEADRMIKNGADGYSTIERLICGAGK
ncbi:MAG: DNA polymerase III subunit delta [Clostridia bacterium]|nr:DNA polymerase III subunit delta [Clostridia bacterium]